jgi:hypothetical protein
VAAAEKVYKTVRGNRVRAHGGGAIEGRALLVQQGRQTRDGVLKIAFRGSQRID